MRKLRLLVTKICTRNCVGCSNNDIKPFGTINIFELLQNIKEGAYTQIMITGGEPLLFPDLLLTYLTTLQSAKGEEKQRCGFPALILYASWLPKHLDNDYLVSIFSQLNGITFTMHDEDGLKDFKRLNDILCMMHYKPSSMRLNVFCDVKLPPITLHGWNVKFIEWIKDCPLPEGEEFLQLDPLWQNQNS